MNKITIIGNLTRDPETGTTPNGVNYTRFTVAVQRRYKKNNGQEADFIRVTAWRGLGDTCAKFLRKGRKVAVVGSADVSAYTGKDGTARASMEVTADEVEFLSPKGQDDGSAGSTDASGMTVVDSAEAQAVFDDEAPF